MKMLKVFFVVLCGFALTSAQAQYSSGSKVSRKIVDSLVGVWQLHKAYDGKKEIPITKQRAVINFIQFTREYKYSLVMNTSKSDSGYFRANEPQRLIYLESANNPNNHTPDEWRVKILKDTLTLSKTEPANERNFRYVYARQIHKEEH